MYMNKKDDSSFIRTTVWLPRHLHEEAKIMAILTRSNLSTLMRSALLDKIKQLRDNNASRND